MQALLERLKKSFADNTRYDNSELVALLAQGDDAPEGSENALATMAQDMKLTLGDITAMAGHVTELRRILPLAASLHAHRETARYANARFNEAKAELKKTVAALEANLKKLWIQKSGCDARGTEITHASIRLDWYQQEYPELVAAVAEHQNITLPVQVVQSPSLKTSEEPSEFDRLRKEIPHRLNAPLTPTFEGAATKFAASVDKLLAARIDAPAAVDLPEEENAEPLPPSDESQVVTHSNGFPLCVQTDPPPATSRTSAPAPGPVSITGTMADLRERTRADRHRKMDAKASRQ